MLIDTIMVDFTLLSKVNDGVEFRFYQLETPIALAPYFPRFYIDEDGVPVPIRRDGEFPLIPETAIIIIN